MAVLWRVVELKRVDLVRLNAESAGPEALWAGRPGQLDFNVTARGIQLPDVPGFLVEATITMTGEDAETKERRFSVEATHRLVYSYPEGVEPTLEQLQSFAERNGVFNAWSYWREILDSTLRRMNLTVPMLPMHRVGDYAKSQGATATE